MRLGVAMQLGIVRYLGTFLDDLTEAPPRVSAFVGRQIGVAPGSNITAYQSSQWRWRHEKEIPDRYCQIASNRDPLSRPILTPLARDGISWGKGMRQPG